MTSCRITMEFFDQTETVGFDNFGRLAASCPPIDDTVQIHDPALTDCGYDSFVGIGNMPHSGNPGAPSGPALRRIKTLSADTSKSGSCNFAFIKRVLTNNADYSSLAIFSGALQF